MAGQGLVGLFGCADKACVIISCFVVPYYFIAFNSKLHLGSCRSVNSLKCSV